MNTVAGGQKNSGVSKLILRRYSSKWQLWFHLGFKTQPLQKVLANPAIIWESCLLVMIVKFSVDLSGLESMDWGGWSLDESWPVWLGMLVDWFGGGESCYVSWFLVWFQSSSSFSESEGTVERGEEAGWWEGEYELSGLCWIFWHFLLVWLSGVGRLWIGHIG